MTIDERAQYLARIAALELAAATAQSSGNSGELTPCPTWPLKADRTMALLGILGRERQCETDDIADAAAMLVEERNDLRAERDEARAESERMRAVYSRSQTIAILAERDALAIRLAAAEAREAGMRAALVGIRDVHARVTDTGCCEGRTLLGDLHHSADCPLMAARRVADAALTLPAALTLAEAGLWLSEEERAQAVEVLEQYDQDLNPGRDEVVAALALLSRAGGR